ncbi:MAG: isoleucine--tRNA ligase, partial [Devosia sp.]
AQIARELFKFAATGQLYRGSKPVMWSVVERTALAEAEIEYQDYESDQIWVKFPVRAVNIPADEIDNFRVFGDAHQEGEDVVLTSDQPNFEWLVGADVVIWTTTPWTIPGNRAISFSSRISYALFEVTAPEDEATPRWAKFGDRYIIAENLADDVFAKAKVPAGGWCKVDDVPWGVLEYLTASHPLRGFAAGYDFPVPLLDGEHVTDDTGTGFVHTAPGHGLDDFDIWMSSGRMLAKRGIDTTIPYTVDDAGFYTRDAPGFEGARVLDDSGKKGDANQRVTNALAERGMMVARGRVKHQYPHSWRSKKPIIFRNTPQWFVYMDKPIGEDPSSARSLSSGARRAQAARAVPDTLRNRALAAIDATKFYPPAGQNRLRSMIAERPDWVLSRQRAWGVPIAVFVNKESGETLVDEAVNHRIAAAFEEEGADAWFKPGARERFLGGAYNPDEWEKIDDILDVWFESGTTHSWVLRNKQKWPNLAFPASMYLEGSDQHRGWFHSSLLESCATNGFAPYRSVLTHGFTMDAEGRKMSKSLGNVVAPQDVIKQYGADILRLWVASVDYSEDQRLGKEIIATTVDSYRKLRNSLRWLLGNLAHYKPEEAVALAEMREHKLELELLILHRLSELDTAIREAYRQYDYKRVVATLSNFMNVELSAFYFDIRKDALYCDPISSVRRKACLTVLDSIFDCLTAWLAPILVFTMEECWLERHSGAAASVHLRLFPEIAEKKWDNDALSQKWEYVKRVRKSVTEELEVARRDKLIGSSLEASPKVIIRDPQLWDAVKDVDLAEVCITSSIEKVKEPDTLGEDYVSVVFAKAEGIRCARSWKVTTDVGSDPDYPDLSARDARAMRERQAAGL